MRLGHLGNGNGKVPKEKVLRQELILTGERGNGHGEAGRSV